MEKAITLILVAVIAIMAGMTVGIYIGYENGYKQGAKNAKPPIISPCALFGKCGD